MSEKVTSRQEYLDRLLSGNTLNKKVKKKKLLLPKKKITGLKIIDDDIDIKALGGDEIVDECGEDAPVIAEIIDERPVLIQQRDKKRGSCWKRIGDNEEENSQGEKVDAEKKITSLKKRHDSDSDLSPERITSTKTFKKCDQIIDCDGDFSPPRSHNKSVKSVKKSNENFRRQDNSDNSAKKYEEDFSPIRNRKSSKNRHEESDVDTFNRKRQSLHKSKTTKIHNSDQKFSPVKNRKNHRSDSDNDIFQSQRTHNNDRDVSLPRKTQRNDSDSDISLPRKASRNDSDSDISLPRKASRNDSDSDISLPRKTQRNDSDSDISLPRKTHRNDGDSDNSLPQKVLPSKMNKSHSGSDKKSRPSTTLSGMKAGLQHSSTLREEAKLLRKKENKHIRDLASELSGRNAKTIYRNRETGEKIDLKAVQEKKEKEDEKQAERKAKYSEWGKGLEQKQEQMKKFEDDVYEMSKPLARYKDDEDLDRELRNKIHEEDPMFEYMKKKKKKEQNLPEYPKYIGPPPPINRFNILPGYRWDGVDRSNGFERRYFEKINQSKAREIESHLWSVQDM